jgi:2-keto-4-pentenoate hydratase/2-oxohepta-3-ene-1,7-dioic acid hydratase in catechol pathway
MTYSLATLRINDKPTPVLLCDDTFYRLSAESLERLGVPTNFGLIDLFRDWLRIEPLLSAEVDAHSRGAVSWEKVETPSDLSDYLSPLQFPSKIVAIGANYYEHVHLDAGMTDFRKENSVPVLFTRPPTTSLVGSGRSVRYPTQTEMLDYEVELAAVISQRAFRVSRDEAMDYVAGFTIALDMSARDLQLHPKHIKQFDLFGGKCFDDSNPLGSTITPARFVDHANLNLKLSVNGEMRQNANTSDMIWSLEEAIEAMSTHVTLEAGDVILTGTPAGVGMRTGRYLKVGDKIDAEIEGLGSLSVEIVHR